MVRREVLADVRPGRRRGVSASELSELVADRPIARAVLEAIADGRLLVGRFDFGLSSRFGGDSSVRERDLDAGAAEVDHRDQRVGGVESVGAV